MNAMTPIGRHFSIFAAVALCGCQSPKPTTSAHISTPTGSSTAAKTKPLPSGVPRSSEYLTYPDGSMVPCAYHTFGHIKAVVVIGIHPKASISPKPRSADDLVEEKHIREEIQKGQFMPGIYRGGPVTYSTGLGLHVFTP